MQGKAGKVSKWVQRLVDKGFLKYETDPDTGEIVVTQGENYLNAPKHFRMLFESKDLL